MSEAPTSTVCQDYDTESLEKEMSSRLNKYFDANGRHILDSDESGMAYLEKRGSEIYKVIEDEDAIAFDEGPLDTADAMYLIYSAKSVKTPDHINARCAYCGKELQQFEAPHKKEYGLKGCTIVQWVYRCSRCGYLEVF